jgi:hypothetical protein
MTRAVRKRLWIAFVCIAFACGALSVVFAFPGLSARRKAERVYDTLQFGMTAQQVSAIMSENGATSSGIWQGYGKWWIDNFLFEIYFGARDNLIHKSVREWNATQPPIWLSTVCGSIGIRTGPLYRSATEP